MPYLIWNDGLSLNIFFSVTFYSRWNLLNSFVQAFTEWQHYYFSFLFVCLFFHIYFGPLFSNKFDPGSYVKAYGLQGYG